MVLEGLHALHRASLAPSWARFQAAARFPAAAQRRRFTHQLEAREGTAFAREHALPAKATLEQFRRRVPIGDFESHRAAVERIANGEAHVLTRAPVQMLERTSGSTSGLGKLVPYTQGLLDEFNAATGPWLFDLHRAHPGLSGTRAYWSVSPVARERERTLGGLPVGFESDTEYLPGWQRRAVEATLAVPPQVARLPDLTAWREATLVHLLEAGDLGLISAWSPSFVTLLMDALVARFPELVAKLPAARARAVLEAVAHEGAVTGRALWPRLQLLSCWTDATAADLLPALERHFPGTPVQGKGLLATEGVVSFPLHGHAGAVLAVQGHFLEFLDLDAPNRPPRLAHELRVGGAYSPVLTTLGGLTRYRLPDALRCVGHFHATPLVRFDGRLDGSSDLCGEKLSAREVDLALEAVRTSEGLQWTFALVAPAQTPGEPPRYQLFLETQAPDAHLQAAAQVLETRFLTGHHYRYCRDLGQLGAVTALRVRDGERTFHATLLARGLKPGNIKPTHLDTGHGWAQAFGASP